MSHVAVALEVGAAACWGSRRVEIAQGAYLCVRAGEGLLILLRDVLVLHFGLRAGLHMT